MNDKNFVLRALGYNYTRLSDYKIVDSVEKVFAEWDCPLTPRQKECLRREWCGEYGRVPFRAYDWGKEPDVKNNIWWRLSVVPLIIWLILLVAVIPFKWLVTGKATYKNSPNKKTIAGVTMNWFYRCFTVK